ncbi:hypothetical protein KUTeg_006451 [Tegillarca granosa]|uniref:G-protein coupled receptors family 1 profile domain-containing protein n=1 Tax=Tegillarca granosa TaxID=220873 RepID=A0ABQ9FKH9_TEGGR|nr:hypothetical protein KUTeg_006451 [Tegillarca granosa]
MVNNCIKYTITLSDVLIFSVTVILSLFNIKTPREIYAVVIIFVLPINAAVNPYLYTIGHIDLKKVKTYQ